MARITDIEVRNIIETSITEGQMQRYIDSAAALSTLLDDKGINSTILKEIECWLTAHLIASTRDRQAREEGAGTAYVKYSGLTYTGLKGTTYGQHALMLDYSGTLEIMSGRRLMRFFAVKEGE